MHKRTQTQTANPWEEPLQKKVERLLACIEMRRLLKRSCWSMETCQIIGCYQNTTLNEYVSSEKLQPFLYLLYYCFTSLYITFIIFLFILFRFFCHASCFILLKSYSSYSCNISWNAILKTGNGNEKTGNGEQGTGNLKNRESLKQVTYKARVIKMGNL